MISYRALINHQISINNSLNLFCENSSLQFSHELLDRLTNTKYRLNDDSLIDYTVNRVLTEFYRVNQYFHFDKQAIQELKLIYTNLYRQLDRKDQTREELAYNHKRNLTEWLRKENPFSIKIYSSKQKTVDVTPCFEYTPDLQLRILHVDLDKLQEPILDIGCGQHANLVKYLRQKGKIAFGIDRYNSSYNYFQNYDWLNYDFETEKWGTIISNLGFSNHFLHHHLRIDGNYICYAKKYKEILDSLKVGGKFHYAPSLPFIEEYLDIIKYRVITEKNLDNQSTIVQKIK